MRILALEPYYGGSHRAFLDGWVARSQHSWRLLTLPDHHWKWRMRHAAITFARQLRTGEEPDADVVFTSDMLDVAAFRSLAPTRIGALPVVLYFHENQLTYPDHRRDEADYHFAFTNLTSALAADRVWFNSDYHCTEFLDALREFLSRMPDHAPTDAVDVIAAKSSVHSPGIEHFPARGERRTGPLRILWSARWEADKNPQTFFDALHALKKRGVGFELLVVGGQSGPTTPGVFDEARQSLAAHIRHWGYAEDREAYRQILLDADVVVSTAVHEFFGIAIAEAVAAGGFPIVPDRLAYPELLCDAGETGRNAFFYDGSVGQLTDMLAAAAHRLDRGNLWTGDPALGARAVQRAAWNQVVTDLDTCLSELR